MKLEEYYIMKKPNLTLISILSMIFSTTFATSKYEANLEQTLMTGNKRNIGRTGIVVPVWQKGDKILFLSGIGLIDSKSALEGNFGAGIRVL